MRISKAIPSKKRLREKYTIKKVSDWNKNYAIEIFFVKNLTSYREITDLPLNIKKYRFLDE